MKADLTPAVLAYISLGANLGDARANVQRALACLQDLPASRLQAQSSLFSSTPVESDGADYINAVACLATHLPAADLLLALQALEHSFGRERPYHNAARSLDLDILLYGAEQINSAQLTVPHPRLTRRAFALLPLLQLDPFIVIPGQGPAHTFAAGVAGQIICKI